MNESQDDFTVTSGAASPELQRAEADYLRTKTAQLSWAPWIFIGGVVFAAALFFWRW